MHNDSPIDGYFGDNPKDLSRQTGSEMDKGQMGREHWSDINFNFDRQHSIAVFYGCNSFSWAEDFLEMNKNNQVRYTVGNPGPAIGMETVRGQLDRAFFTSQDIFLRSHEGDTVLPMDLFTRGSDIIREIYGNPTITIKK